MKIQPRTLPSRDTFKNFAVVVHPDPTPVATTKQSTQGRLRLEQYADGNYYITR